MMNTSQPNICSTVKNMMNTSQPNICSTHADCKTCFSHLCSEEGCVFSDFSDEFGSIHQHVKDLEDEEAYFEPWPNGIASPRKFAKLQNLGTDLRCVAKQNRKSTQERKTRTWVRTCDGRPNGIASRLASSRKSQAINFAHIKMTCDQLGSTSVGGQTVKSLRRLAYESELNQSRRKFSGNTRTCVRT